MEVFKTEVLKREFKKIVENVLLLLNECGNCGVFCCEYCKKFSVNCTLCQKARCKSCCTFERPKELLLNSGDKVS